MSKIKNLIESYKENKTKTKHFLSDYLYISEKLKANRFSFELKNNKILFFGKKSNKPLSIIDRTISDLYEDTINFILQNISISLLKENVRYGCYIFNKYTEHQYKKIPKNKIILTDIKVNGKNINNSNELQKIGKKLNIQVLKNIFEGTLSKEVKQKLFNDLEKNEKINESFKNIFNEKFEKSSLGGKPVGFIIKSNFKKQSYLQIELKTKEKLKKIDSNIFELTLIDIYYFVENFDFTTIKVKGKNLELKYINLVCDLFNNFIQKNKKIILQSNLKKPIFLKNSGNLSKKFISNKETLSLIENETYEYLLRIFLTTFKNKIKKRGLLTENNIISFNLINKKLDEFLKLDEIVDFIKFKDILS